MCETRDLGITWRKWYVFNLWRASGHETCLPKRCEENVHETSEIDLLEEVGSEAWVWRVEMRYLAWASSGSVAKEDTGGMEWQASTCRNEAGSGRRMGRWILDGRAKVYAKDAAKKRERKSIYWIIAQVGVCQTSDSRGFQKVVGLQAFVEVAKRHCGALSKWKPVEQGTFQREEMESEKHKKLEKGFKSTWLQMALIWAWLESGMPVVGQWCRWVTTKNWAFAWDVWLDGGRTWSPAHHQDGNKEIIDGSWRGERKCIDPKAGGVGWKFHGEKESKDSAAREKRSASISAACSQLSLLGGTNGKIVRSLAEAKRKVDLCGQEKRGNKVSKRNGVLLSPRTDAWDVEGSANPWRCQGNAQGRSTCHEIWESGESEMLGATIWKEEWTDRVKFWFGAENARVVRGREWDSNWWTVASPSK